MPDRVTGSGGLSAFWLAMFFQARRRQLAENKRKRDKEKKEREQEEEIYAKAPELVTLRFLATMAPPAHVTAITKRLRANDDARALSDFIKFMESVALEEID